MAITIPKIANIAGVFASFATGFALGSVSDRETDTGQKSGTVGSLGRKLGTGTPLTFRPQNPRTGRSWPTRRFFLGSGGC